MVKFSPGDENLKIIVFLVRELLKEKFNQPLLAANDSSQSQQTLLGTEIGDQSAGEGVLTQDVELLEDLGLVLSSVQGKS